MYIYCRTKFFVLYLEARLQGGEGSRADINFYLSLVLSCSIMQANLLLADHTSIFSIKML
jgi:hypothetical protein